MFRLVMLALIARVWEGCAKECARSGWIRFLFSVFLQGVFSLVPPKKLKYGKPRLGESTLT